MDMQAMDRVHRIGQTKPVHVYRLLTAHSVEGKMLARANSKLKLEKLVITHGGFTDAAGSAKAGSMRAEDLIALLRGDAGADADEGAEPQSGVISDADLRTIMDRRDMDGTAPRGAAPPPTRGTGFELVDDLMAQKSLLTDL